MKWTILGSGGCTVIPKPLCDCRVCIEAREKGIPYARTGPSAFLHDINLLIDTPAEIAQQLNRENVDKIDYLLLSHLDPDHVEGFRIVEQIALDFRSWKAYPEKQIKLVLPESLKKRIPNIQSQYGPLVDFYEKSGFIRIQTFSESIEIGDVRITAIAIHRGDQVSSVYILEKSDKKVVYAPCDIKPFPKGIGIVQNADLLIIQPGIFEDGLKHDFVYPSDHISRNTLYTFEETLELAKRIAAKKVLFMHLEEYWNRNYDDYRALESDDPFIRFAYDGMEVVI